MQKITTYRMVVYAQDIMNMTGLRERAARQILARIRAKYNKKKRELISIDEFCEFTGFKEERVQKYLYN